MNASHINPHNLPLSDPAGGRAGPAAGAGYSYPYRAGESAIPVSGSSLSSYSIGYPAATPMLESTSSTGTALSKDGTTDKVDADTGAEEAGRAKKPRLSRIHQACINCGSKKQKCSGETPCAPCKSQGLECHYRESKKRGPPKGTKRVRKSEPATNLTKTEPEETVEGEAQEPDSQLREQEISQRDLSRPRTSTLTAGGVHGDQSLLATASQTFGNGYPALSRTVDVLPDSAQPQATSVSTYISAPSMQVPVSSHASNGIYGLSAGFSKPQHSHLDSASAFGFGSPSTAFGSSNPTPTSLAQSSLFDPALRESTTYPEYASQYHAAALPYRSPLPSVPQQLQQTQMQRLSTASPTLPNTREMLNRASAFGSAPTPSVSHLSSQSQYNASRPALHERDGVSQRLDPDLSRSGASESADSRLLLFDAAASYSHDGHPKLPDRITEHYRGATSGLPSLHAQRRKSEDYSPGGSLLGLKRGRSDSAQDPWRATRSPALPSSRSAKQEVDVMMPYGLARDVATGVDELFTLPPIRLSNLSNSIVGSPGGGLHIPKGLFDRLINYYFAISHHSCPIIYKPDIDITNIEKQLPPVLLDGMCCLAARFLENEDLAAFFPHLRGVGAEKLRTAREQIEQHYYDRARKTIQDDDYRSDITTVQALLLLSKRDNGSGRMLHCWQLVGSATRMVIDLGLHRGAAILSQGKETSYSVTETRRRVFWQTYIMDKHAAASLGRPVFLREEDIDVRLPSELAADEFDRWVGNYPYRRHGQPPPENRAISTHNAFARLSIILQSIINDVYSTRARKNHFELSQASGEYQYYVVLRSLYSQLCAWKADLPAHLQWAPGGEAAPPLPHQLLLHAFHSTCLLLVFRPVVPISIQENFPSKHHMPRPHDVCTKAADTIMQIMDVYEQSYGLQKVPSSTAVYYIFTAATIYVGNSSSSDQKVANQASQNLDKCIRLLDQLSDAVCAASQHRQILLDITSLGSTKLGSRDDAEDLLSSRVPASRAPSDKSSSPKRSPQSISPVPNTDANQDTARHPSQTAPSNAQQQARRQQQHQQRQLDVPNTQNVQPPNLVQQANMFALQQPLQTQMSQSSGGGQLQNSASLGSWTDIERIRLENQHRSTILQLQQSVPPQNIFGLQSSTNDAFVPMDTSAMQTGISGSYDTQQQPFATDAPFDFSSLNNVASQADLAFWREMPIGCADLSDWDSFTNSYAHQLLTGIPTLGSKYTATGTNGN